MSRCGTHQRGALPYRRGTAARPVCNRARKADMDVAKKTKSQLAAVGTKMDPARTAVADAGGVAADVRLGKGGCDWHLAPLDQENLSRREQLTARIFTTVQVVLCLVLVATVVSLSMVGTGLSADGLQEAFSSNPVMTVSFLSACMQPFIAYLVRFVRSHYAAGDAGYAAANLIVLLCAEMMLQSMVGIVAMAILLWRVWRRGSQVMGDWRRGRGVAGVLVDVSGALVVLVVAGICLFARAQLG